MAEDRMAVLDMLRKATAESMARIDAPATPEEVSPALLMAS